MRIFVIVMWEDLYKYLLVIASSMLKFFFGLAVGTGFKLPFLVTASLTAIGMMLSIMLFTSFLGKYFHRWILNTFYKNRRLFTKSNRKKISIWKRYGIIGVSLLTPILFTPIGGAMIVNAFGETKERIFFFMSISCVLWAFGGSYLLELLKYLPFFN